MSDDAFGAAIARRFGAAFLVTTPFLADAAFFALLRFALGFATASPLPVLGPL
ncbi:MAG: hypothetical protein ING44_12345 [Telmatospirillum sp.]|nr:hypothetical protein [Telmatospirillum sp.]